MNYPGKLYGKVGYEYIPLSNTTEQFDKMYDALNRSYLLIHDYLEMFDSDKVDKKAWEELNKIILLLKEIENENSKDKTARAR